MFVKNHFINLISLILLAFIGFLFLIKYTAIYTGYSFVIPFAYVIIFFLIFYFIGNIDSEKLEIFGDNFFKAFWIAVAAGTLLLITFTPRIGEIGRYPAIVDWLDRFLRGDFPYNSPHTPSAFPFLFFLSYPFYLLGNAGLLVVVGVVIFAFVSLKYSKNQKENLIRAMLLFGTPVIYYCLAVRSELFTNMTLTLGLIYLSEKYLDYKNKNLIFFLLAIGFGLVLSTRSVAAIVYSIYLLYFFRNNLPNLILFSAAAVFVFAVILIPFILWDKESFLTNGPFAIQSFLSYIPMWNVALILVICIYLGWVAADIQEVFFSCGLMLFIPVFLSMVYKFVQFGFYDTMINDIFDLSYYEFAVPFLILSVKDYKVDRFLGKVMEVEPQL